MPDNTQAILILKDSLIVSGITTLAFFAEKNHLPLITSDQGSVQDGAAFALGVHEKEIGVEGAKLAAKILSGEKACQLPIVDMRSLTVFVNTLSISKEGQSLTTVKTAADNLHYNLDLIDEETKTS